MFVIVIYQGSGDSVVIGLKISGECGEGRVGESKDGMGVVTCCCASVKSVSLVEWVVGCCSEFLLNLLFQ